MKVLVVYASRYGNTRMIAQAIADALAGTATVQLAPVASAPPSADGFDLLIVGGPTEQHGMTAEMAAFLKSFGTVRGTRAIAFDTRLRGPRWLWGSAASRIAETLKRAGAELVAPEQSFHVTRQALRGGTPELEEGEIERAEEWAAGLAEREPVPAA